MPSTKSEMRRSALERRDGLNRDQRSTFASRLALVGADLAMTVLPSREKLVVSVFSPIGSEPDTLPLASALHAADVHLVLPVDWSHGTPLVFRRWKPGDRLAIGPMGIAEPLPEAPELEPDVLFVPLLAFDRRGYRVGYGAGNYDRTLAELRSRRTVRAIGVAYAVQEEAVIPNDPHDEPVDVVVTDQDVLVCHR